jgi:hypothetical protein
MHDATDQQQHRGDLAAWVKFVAGILLLTGVILMLMQGRTPPGTAGAVFRNNLRHGIDATPLFYTEVELLTPDE